MWLFNDDPYENADPKTSQENGFSPVWVHMRHFKVDFTEKADPQISQQNGSSPLCVRR